VEHVCSPRGVLSDEECCSAQTPVKESRAIDL